MRLRKPFSMQQKDLSKDVPAYSRKFKRQHSINKDAYNCGIVLCFVVLILSTVAIPRWTENARLHQHKLQALTNAKDTKAFNFLLNSGKSRLHKGQISGAYSEFKLAHNIKPNDDEVNELLLETLGILCFDYNSHCEDLNKLQF